MVTDIETLSNRVRVRACGVLIEDGQILMVKHNGFGQEGYLWIPPGGGVQPGETITAAIQREFAEETGLEVTVGKFLFVNEFINPPLHALEFFFMVEKTGGCLLLGNDPEFSTQNQMITDLKFLSIEDIKSEGHLKVHTRFCDLSSTKQLMHNKGFFNANNKLL